MINLNFLKEKNKKFFLIAGPCVVESFKLNFETAKKIKDICEELDINFVYKSSFLKANRTSLNSFSTIGIEKSLEILFTIKDKLNIPILTDVHSIEQVELLKNIDIIQIPAFLCRQTDLIIEVAKTNKFVNIKKGQFIGPNKVKYIVEKIENFNKKILITERGTSFGYNQLIVDMVGIEIMKKENNYPIIFDGTHSIQINNQLENFTSGNNEYIEALCKSCLALGISGIFLEVHPNPKQALSDKDSQLKLSKLKNVLIKLKKIDNAAKS